VQRVNGPAFPTYRADTLIQIRMGSGKPEEYATSAEGRPFFIHRAAGRGHMGEIPSIPAIFGLALASKAL
jgi:hypothetical protein